MKSPQDLNATNRGQAYLGRLLPIGEIVESPLNPRKHFDPHKLEDLAASIRSHGILTPMLARPLADGTVELAAGHRRFRAAQLAGLDTVPVIVRPMSDDQFLEVLTIENLQREDVHPLEEAEGFEQLINRGYTTAVVADKIGKTEAYVRGRVELLDLVPVARESFLRNAITIGHARLISRLAPEKQEEALGLCFERNWRSQTDELVSVADLRSSIKSRLGARDLNKAPFALDDGSLTANAPACTHCPRCTGIQRSLLADDTSEQTCLDPACYSQKLNAHIMRKTAAGLVAISNHYGGSGAAVPPGVLVSQEFVEVGVDQDRLDELKEEIGRLENMLAKPEGAEYDLEIDPPKSGYGHGHDYTAALKSLIKSAADDDVLWQHIVLFAVGTASMGYGGNDELKALAKQYGIDAKMIEKQVSAPILAKFDAQKAKAKAKEKQAKKGTSKLKSGKMAAAGDDEGGAA